MVDDQTFEKIKSYADTDLTARQTATLQLVDAFLMDPRLLNDGLNAELHRHYTQAQIVALTLKLAHNASNKMRVALGVDRIPDDSDGDRAPDGHRVLDYHRFIEYLEGDEINL